MENLSSWCLTRLDADQPTQSQTLVRCLEIFGYKSGRFAFQAKNVKLRGWRSDPALYFSNKTQSDRLMTSLMFFRRFQVTSVDKSCQTIEKLDQTLWIKRRKGKRNIGTLSARTLEHITITRLCNILRFFTTVKLIFFR